MQFRIADTFTDSLAKLTGEAQKSAKTTAFDLQINSASPGMSFHKLDQARDKHFWSMRVDLGRFVSRPTVWTCPPNSGEVRSDYPTIPTKP